MVRVGVIQMTSTEDPVRNDELAMRLVETAVKDKGANFVCLPECFHCLGRNANETFDVARRTYRMCIEKYQNLAKKLNVWLSLGGIHCIKDKETKMSNCHVILNDDGEIVCEYDKIHLFDVRIPGRVCLMESESTKPGACLRICNTPFGKLGISVCYDLRFPVWSRNDSDYDVLFYLANWPTPRISHWRSLLTARAIENMSYCIGVNIIGSDPGNLYSGGSCIIKPNGDECTKITKEETVIYYELNKNVINDYRGTLNFLDDKDRFILE